MDIYSYYIMIYNIARRLSTSLSKKITSSCIYLMNSIKINIKSIFYLYLTSYASTPSSVMHLI